MHFVLFFTEKAVSGQGAHLVEEEAFGDPK